MSTIPVRGFRIRTIGGLRYGAAAAVNPVNLGVIPQSRPVSTSHITSLIGNLSKCELRPVAVVQGTRSFCSGKLPPHKRIALPALSPTMETGNVVSWQKKEGEQLGEGDLLCEIETDKATMGFEAPEEGYLAKIVIPEGTKNVPIGKLLCIIVDSEDAVAAFKDFKDDGSGAPAAPAAEAAAPAAAETPAPAAPAAAASGGDYPPCSHIAVPALSPTMETAKIVSWGKQEGDEVAEGDVLCDIETDKAVISFESPEEGFLAKIVIPEGTKGVPIGKLLCIMVDSKDKVAAFKDYKDDGATVIPKPPPPSAPSAPAPPPPATAAPTPAPVAAPAPSPPAHAAGHVGATPLAKKLAEKLGVDLKGVPGSGPDGRVLAADLAHAQPGAPAAAAAAPRPAAHAVPGAEYKDIPLTGMRSTIAKRLTASKTTIPHYYLTSEINIDALLTVREKLNKLLAQGTGSTTKISINDFIVKASALACLRVPEVNSFWMDTFIRQNNNVDVSIAVSTPSGLITPIVFNAHAKGLATISAEVVELAARARDGKLQPAEFQGGTFTVSNLGMYGSVTDFTAIINPPQSCILAVGGAETKMVPCENEGYRSTKVMKVTLSCDHRVVDGAVGATWLRHFKEFLEKPHTMLL
uniref:Acetyltransferase component of pyruvate dehydrogenase complex n=1 Tax=Haemonchus contortus TaxID=6289 RepID=A0A7I5EBZ2_HAECO